VDNGIREIILRQFFNERSAQKYDSRDQTYHEFEKQLMKNRWIDSDGRIVKLFVVKYTEHDGPDSHYIEWRAKLAEPIPAEFSKPCPTTYRNKMKLITIYEPSLIGAFKKDGFLGALAWLLKGF